jgi:hypothetical protein
MVNWLDRAERDRVVEAAVRAPSLLNSQPWRFRVRNDEIDLLVDPDRLLATVDASGWAARIGCGAALFNLRIALATIGKPAIVRLMPDHGCTGRSSTDAVTARRSWTSRYRWRCAPT